MSCVSAAPVAYVAYAIEVGYLVCCDLTFAPCLTATCFTISTGMAMRQEIELVILYGCRIITSGYCAHAV